MKLDSKLARPGLWIVLALACAQSPQAFVDCRITDGITPICGLQNPEDLARIPEAPWLVVSQMRRGERPGSLIALPVKGSHGQRLFPNPERHDVYGRQPGWGDPGCPGAPDPARFAPHGIDILRRTDTPVLAVLNHGSRGKREAIELFELFLDGETPAATWRGCAQLPADAQGNDVALTPTGELLVTRMMSRGGGLWQGLEIALGLDTGSVLRWEGGVGWRSVPGTDASGANGVETSVDGSKIYFTAMGSNELVRVDATGDPERVSIPLESGDNLSWAPDGQLLVASHTAGLRALMGCRSIEKGSCGTSFRIVSVDPQSLEAHPILERSGPPIGAVSVAVQVGQQLFLGSFAGDRVGRYEGVREAPASGSTVEQRSGPNVTARR